MIKPLWIEIKLKSAKSAQKNIKTAFQSKHLQNVSLQQPSWNSLMNG